VAACLAAALLALGAAPTPPAGEPPAPPGKLAVGAPAPRFTLPVANADAVGLEALSTRRYVGPAAKEPKRALLLSFAASHCAPCKKELPQIDALARRYADRGVLAAVVAVDDSDEGQAAMLRVARELGLGLPLLVDGYGIVGRRYGAEVLPLNVVVAADGAVAWFAAGYAEENLAAMASALERLAPSRSERRSP